MYASLIKEIKYLDCANMQTFKANTKIPWHKSHLYIHVMTRHSSWSWYFLYFMSKDFNSGAAGWFTGNHSRRASSNRDDCL